VLNSCSESNGTSARARAGVVCRSWRTDVDGCGSCVMVCMSVDCPSVKSPPGCVRGQTFASHFYIQRRRGGGCRLVHYSHADIRYQHTRSPVSINQSINQSLYPTSERSETGGYTVLLAFPSVRPSVLLVGNDTVAWQGYALYRVSFGHFLA